MKDYKEVVEQRYNQEDGKTASMYDADQAIGKYTRKYLFGTLKTVLNETVGNVADAKLLDVGCGDGGMIRFFLSEGFSAENVSGVDLSESRIERAKDNTPGVSFYCQDALNFEFADRFDLITSFDLFSHLSSEEQIVNGLTTMKNHLAENGTVLWYDICSKDHYSPPEGVDSWGFSEAQMIDLVEKAGFRVKERKRLFKVLFNRYHSVYQARRFPEWFVRLLETILPGRPGNVLLVLEKAEG